MALAGKYVDGIVVLEANVLLFARQGLAAVKGGLPCRTMKSNIQKNIAMTCTSIGTQYIFLS